MSDLADADLTRPMGQRLGPEPDLRAGSGQIKSGQRDPTATLIILLNSG